MHKFLDVFEDIRGLTEDVEFAGILDEIKKEFIPVKGMIEYAIQKTIKMKNPPGF